MKLIKKNDSVYKNIESEIKEVLIKFQEGYIKRDKSLVDSYMDELFAKSADTVMVGTCDSEWCLGFEEAKEMVESDWQYWGDLRIDTENPDISTDGNIAWFITEGTVKYSFEDSDEKYQRWLNSIMEHFSDNGDYAVLSDKAKLAQINWMLSLFMSSRPDEKRSYKWPLRLTGVLGKVENRWVFRSMQFCLPNKADYPDVRYTNIEEFEKEYKDSNKRLDEFKKLNPMYCNNEISDILASFQTEYTLKNSEDFVSKYFITDDSISITDMTEGTFNGETTVKNIIEGNKAVWDSLYLDSERALTSVSGDSAWITASGYIKKSIKENAAVLKQIESIKKIFADISSNENACQENLSSGTDLSDGRELSPLLKGGESAKEKLFKIRKEISLMFRETSKGDEYILPVRFEGVMLKEDNAFKFHTVRFSYPYYWVIEGHYDAIAVMKKNL